MAMLETYRGSVQTWECDPNAHMNVQFYVSRALDGVTVMERALGLSGRQAREQQIGLSVREHHIRFHRERHAGDPITIETGVLGICVDELQLYQEMRSPHDHSIVATFISYCNLVDQQTRQVQSLPEDMHRQAEQWFVDLPEHGRPRGVEQLPPRRAPQLNEPMADAMLPTYTGLVHKRDDDGFGYMNTSAYIARISDAVPVMIASAPGLERSTESGMGGAALEYRLIYRSPPMLGDVLIIRSGLKAVLGKAYSWCHWLFNRDTGHCVATAESVVVSLDLMKRRAVNLPDDVKHSLQQRVIAGLSI